MAICDCRQSISSVQETRCSLYFIFTCVSLRTRSTPEEEYYFRRGNEAQDKGNWKEAVDYFTKAVESNDRNANNLYHLAYCLQEVLMKFQFPEHFSCNSWSYSRELCGSFLFVTVSCLFRVCRLRPSQEGMNPTTRPSSITVRCLPSIRYITRPGITSATCKKSWRSFQRPLSVSTKRLR